VIGRLLSFVDGSPQLRGQTALVVTADHGGIDDSHRDPARIENQRVPFFVWGPGVTAGADLYRTSPDRTDPALALPGNGAARAPIRNGDAANTSLRLLGLPKIPGSVLGGIGVTIPPARAP
jgi:hypothetical protein